MRLGLIAWRWWNQTKVSANVDQRPAISTASARVDWFYFSINIGPMFPLFNSLLAEQFPRFSVDPRHRVAFGTGYACSGDTGSLAGLAALMCTFRRGPSFRSHQSGRLKALGNLAILVQCRSLLAL
jgi:hypothetical protein